MRRLIPGVLLLAVMSGAAGCNNNTTTNPTTPTTPTTPGSSTTETFSGTLNMNGGASFPFVAGAAGTVTAALTTVAPDSTVAIGLSLGAWTGTACQISIANDSATQTAIITGTVTAAAALCVRVYDTGKVTAAQPVDFTVTIVHP
jgi:hypothetical protein